MEKEQNFIRESDGEIVGTEGEKTISNFNFKYGFIFKSNETV